MFFNCCVLKNFALLYQMEREKERFWHALEDNSAHAGNAAAQAFFEKVFGAIVEMTIPLEDMGLHDEPARLPRVAQYAGTPLASNSVLIAKRSRLGCCQRGLDKSWPLSDQALA